MVAVIGIVPAAIACMFHGYVPQKTIVDYMLDSEHIVLARQAADDEFRYEAFEALVGDLDGVTIPTLVDSHSRRMFQVNPEGAVLFARDPADSKWQRLRYLDPEFQDFVRQLLQRLPGWGAGDDADRHQFFADLHNHANPNVRDLALLELDRIDYAALRTLDLNLDVDALITPVDNPLEMHLRSIRVLLMGLSKDPAAEGVLAKGVSETNLFDIAFAGAYATAWLELSGAEAARAMTELYLKDPDAPMQKKGLIIEAMAIHSHSGTDTTRIAIISELESALDQAPALGPAVARHFGARYDWSLGDALAATLKKNAIRSPMDVLTVNQYVSLAANSAGPN